MYRPLLFCIVEHIIIISKQQGGGHLICVKVGKKNNIIKSRIRRREKNANCKAFISFILFTITIVIALKRFFNLVAIMIVAYS